MRYNHFLLMLLTSVATANAQNISLDNPWQKNSAFLYVGVANVLLIKGQQASLVSVASDESSVRRTGDSVIITITQPGPIKITALHKNGTSQSFRFTAKYLPPLQLQLFTNTGTYKKELNKTVLESGCTLQITPDEKTLYNDYTVIAFSISIDGRDFYHSNNRLSAQTIPSLGDLQPGNHFSVKEISLYNKTTGNKISVMVNDNYKVL